MALKTDYKNDVFEGRRKYNVLDNGDGTKSFEDVTEYEEEGDNFSSGDINATNAAINNLSEVLVPETSLIAEGTQDLTLVRWRADTDKWEGSPYGSMVYYSGKLYGTGSVIKITGHTGDEEKTAYAGEITGEISTALSGYIVGAFVEGGNCLSVCIQSPQIGIPAAYTENMQKCVAFAGDNGEVWLQLAMPEAADGFLLHVGDTPYDGSGTSWGDLIADVTDDSVYHGGHNHYTDDNSGTGYPNGTQKYYNAFPYKNSIVNILDNASNKTGAKAGGQIHAYYFEGDVLDAVGLANGGVYGITYETGILGTAAVFDGVFGTRIGMSGIDTTFLGGNWTIFASIKPGKVIGIQSIISFYNGSFTTIGLNNDKIAVWMNTNMADTPKAMTDSILVADNYYRIAVRRDTAYGIDIFVDNVNREFNSYVGTDGDLSGNNFIGDQTYFSTSRNFEGSQDEFIIMDRAATNEEIANDYEWHGGSV